MRSHSVKGDILLLTVTYQIKKEGKLNPTEN